ncbi:site-specific integrase [Bordetella flabilis]|uniref:Tyr recombinase domain-containing protein n=1 Tax=Bordetella flabilis TaxID=463014 RepID=A0A193GMJ5_9BORD|nr:site-specific integrase [Bordetella flabilis]ANN80823.1 hypothetical protein BAU07_26205 [Bordetella flabilis]
MAINDGNVRIDGSKTPLTLIDRISSEEWVGASLQSKSRDDYARKILVLENQIRAAEGNATKVTPARMAAHLAWLFAQQKIAQATARSLKAAVLFWLAETAQAVIAHGSDGLSEYEQAYESVRALATNSLPRRTSQTSSPKLKALPKDALDTLELYGKSTPGVVYVGTLLAFLRANLLVGLRPEEWFDAATFSYLGPNARARSSCLGLIVRNSKASHGRANGTHREILLHSISAEDLATLLHFLGLIEAHRAKNPTLSQDQLAKSFFGPLRHCMSNALKRAGYRPGSAARPTLYSSRHQAVANAKASGLTDREIAALFGHVSPATAKSHYGKKMSGWMKNTFRPSPESLMAVSGQSPKPDVARPDDRTLQAATEWLKSPGAM